VIVDLGQDVHGGGFPLSREEDVGFVRVNEFKTEIDVARDMLDVLKESFRVSRVVFDSSTVREAREGQRGVKAQVQPGSGSSRPRGPSRRWRDTSEWDTPGVYYADLTLGGQAVTVKLLVRERKRDSGIQARYLYTTDLSLSEEIEEACCVGDRGPPRDVKALGLEDSSFWGASGLPHDLHHQQRRQGAGRRAEPEERGGVPQVR